MEDRGNTALEMLTFFNDELRKKNIDLIVVPFPNRHYIIADVFSDLVPADRIVQPYRLKFHQELLRRNIEVLNLVPSFLTMRNQYSPLYYNCADMHPADGAIRLTAKEIANRLARYDFRSSAGAKQELRLVTGSFKVPPQYTLFPPGAEYMATKVQTADGKPVVLGLHNSPILVVGDSLIGVPTDYGLPGADLLAHLSYLTGVFPSRIQGTASSILQVIARLGPNALKDIRVLVFMFHEDVMYGRNAGQFAYLFNWVIVDLP